VLKSADGQFLDLQYEKWSVWNNWTFMHKGQERMIKVTKEL